jgi:hypothetical protein
MKKTIFIILALILLILPAISADFFTCFTKGDEVNFCNSNTQDRVCESTSCKYCMKKYNSEEDCYIQGSFNACNSEAPDSSCETSVDNSEALQVEDSEKDNDNDKTNDKKPLTTTQKSNSPTGNSIISPISVSSDNSSNSLIISFLGILTFLEILALIGLFYYSQYFQKTNQETQKKDSSKIKESLK